MAASPKKKQRTGPTRERILTAAELLFAERGFDRVSMPEIGEASGITAGAIYKHFESKDDLFFEVVRRAVEAAPTPSAELPEIVAAFTDPELGHVRRMAVEIHHASAVHPKVRKMLRRAIDERIAQLRDGIREARQPGQTVADYDPELLATMLMVLILGLSHMETLAPRLIGDTAWRDFVKARISELVGE